jgi:hypothetical protein
MKFVEPSAFTDPDVAARKLIEIANSVEAIQEGRIHIELVNRPFLDAGAAPGRFRAALERAISLGWLWRPESGTNVKFTPAVRLSGAITLIAMGALSFFASHRRAI